MSDAKQGDKILDTHGGSCSMLAILLATGRKSLAKDA
jgi:hypothetical protein